jgi:hypothetical protein
VKKIVVTRRELGGDSALQHTRARLLTDCQVAYFWKRIRVSSGECESLFPVGNNKGRKLKKTLYRTWRVSVVLKMFDKNEHVKKISSCSSDSKFKCSVETSRLWSQNPKYKWVTTTHPSRATFELIFTDLCTVKNLTKTCSLQHK